MKKNFSGKLLAASLFSALILGAASAAAMDEGAVSAPEIDNPADIAAIKEIGRIMGDAMVADDIGKLNEIFADDWMSIAMSGEKINKQNLLDRVRGGEHKLVSYELGPIDVQVLGNVAVAGGRVFERRIRDGKEVSMNLVYMDLLEKRDGRWLVVRSEGAAAK